MVCPFLAPYTERTVRPKRADTANVCFADGTEYWPYAPVGVPIQERLCFTGSLRGCPRLKRAVAQDRPYPDGVRPSEQDRAGLGKAWWQFWR